MRPLYYSVLLVISSMALTLRANQITFEGLADNTTLTSQFPGLVFSNAIILTAGIGLNEFEFPPHSGTNVASDILGPMSITFTNPVASISSYFTYLTGLTMTAFGSGNNQVGQTVSMFGNNLALSGDPTSSPNELLTVAFTGGISSVTITGDPTGGSFTLDDLTYTPATSAVPEHSSFFLLLTGTTALMVARKRYLQ